MWAAAREVDLSKLVMDNIEFDEITPNAFIAAAYKCIDNCTMAWEDFSHARNAANAGGYAVANTVAASDVMT